LAHSTGINKWVLKNARSAGISIEHATWTREVLPEITDILVSIQYNGESIHGWGADRQEELALTKAFAEATERVVVHEQKMTNSNGLAAHTDPTLACELAVNELQERDLFLCHYLTRTPFVRIFSPENKYPELEAWLVMGGIKQNFFHLGNQGIVYLLDGRSAQIPFGFIISISRKNSAAEATDSAVISASRTAHRLYSKHRTLQTLTLNEFRKIKHPSFSHHGELALDVDFANQIAYLFEGAGHTIPELNSAAPALQLFQPQIESLRSCSLHVAHAISDKYQSCSLPIGNRLFYSSPDFIICFDGS
jgi:hypothetical protein